ncbi:MAG: hypothetical protein ACI8P0_001587 [Planctomycetaceae bacterium]|jgi:hypothetical protein
MVRLAIVSSLNKTRSVEAESVYRVPTAAAPKATLDLSERHSDWASVQRILLNRYTFRVLKIQFSDQIRVSDHLDSGKQSCRKT